MVYEDIESILEQFHSIVLNEEDSTWINQAQANQALMVLEAQFIDYTDYHTVCNFAYKWYDKLLRQKFCMARTKEYQRQWEAEGRVI